MRGFSYHTKVPFVALGVHLAGYYDTLEMTTAIPCLNDHSHASLHLLTLACHVQKAPITVFLNAQLIFFPLAYFILGLPSTLVVALSSQNNYL